MSGDAIWQLKKRLDSQRISIYEASHVTIKSNALTLKLNTKLLNNAPWIEYVFWIQSLLNRFH
jgi:hypothetical protein